MGQVTGARNGTGYEARVLSRGPDQCLQGGLHAAPGGGFGFSDLELGHFS
jgi:hypothetical protein